jgi:hypothetical protein
MPSSPSRALDRRLLILPPNAKPRHLTEAVHSFTVNSAVDLRPQLSVAANRSMLRYPSRSPYLQLPLPFAVAVVRSFAVILSGVKDPDTFHPPIPLEPSNPNTPTLPLPQKRKPEAPRKSVKPQNRETPRQSSEITWRISSSPSSIMDTEVKTERLPQSSIQRRPQPIENKYFAHNPFRLNILQAPPNFKLLK